MTVSKLDNFRIDFDTVAAMVRSRKATTALRAAIRHYNERLDYIIDRGYMRHNIADYTPETVSELLNGDYHQILGSMNAMHTIGFLRGDEYRNVAKYLYDMVDGAIVHKE